MDTKITRRLKLIQGQVGGILKMAEENRDCEDIILQIAAVNASLSSVAKLIMQHHIQHCVVDGIKTGDEVRTVERLQIALDRFLDLR